MKYLITVLCSLCLLTIGCSNGVASPTPTPEKFSLEIESSTGGTAHAGSNGDFTLLSNVDIYAVSDVGYKFYRWTLCSGERGAFVANERAASTVVSITGDTCIKANFVDVNFIEN